MERAHSGLRFVCQMTISSYRRSITCFFLFLQEAPGNPRLRIAEVEKGWGEGREKGRGLGREGRVTSIFPFALLLLSPCETLP